MTNTSWYSRASATGLRIAGTAELSGFDLSLNHVRCQALLDRTLEIFPGAFERSEAQFWTGLRPATPSNVPHIGATRYPNFFLNTGHGTLGWTHSCGSARALADIVSGRRPEVLWLRAAFLNNPAQRNARSVAFRSRADHQDFVNRDCHTPDAIRRKRKAIIPTRHSNALAASNAISNVDENASANVAQDFCVATRLNCKLQPMRKIIVSKSISRSLRVKIV